jgi:hypothetical protein
VPASWHDQPPKPATNRIAVIILVRATGLRMSDYAPIRLSRPVTSESSAATDSQNENRSRHRARFAFLNSEATSLCAVSSPCWLYKCLAAFETPLKYDTFFFSHISST